MNESELLVYLTNHPSPVKVDTELNEELKGYDSTTQAKKLTALGILTKDKLNNTVFYPSNRIRKVKIING